MNKTKLLAVALLSACLGLVSCGKKSVSSSSEEVSSSSALVAGKIVLNAEHPTEIAVNDEINLEDYVTVTKVDTWTAEVSTESEGIVSVDGHKIKGLDIGDFSVTIIAGKSKKAYVGKVVSDEKKAFNTFLNGITNNYDVSFYGALDSDDNPTTDSGASLYNLGETRHAGSYVFAGDSYTDETQKVLQWAGTVDAPDGNSYDFTVDQNTDTTSADDGKFSNLVLKSGLRYTLADNGYGDQSLTGEEFTEDADKDGNLLGQFTIVDSAFDEYNTVLDNFLSLSMLSGTSYVGNWLATGSSVYGATFRQNTDSSNAAIEGDWMMQFIAIDASKDVSYLPVYVELSGVGTSGLSLIDDWVKTPVYPAKLDASPISTAANTLFTSKTFTANVVANWYDKSSGTPTVTTSPSNLKYSDGTEVLFAFTETMYVNPTTAYGEITSISADNSAESAKGDVMVYMNRTVDSVAGIYYGSGTNTDGTLAFTKSGLSTTKIGDIWDSTKTPVFLTKTADADAVGAANFTSATTNADESVTYAFNEKGDEANLLEDVWGLDTLGLGGLIEENLAYNDFLLYTYNEITVSKAGGITLSVGLTFSSSIYYDMTISFSAVGTDAVPAGLEAKIFPAA